ncbi:MAG: helix-turn-helix domain-containing protein [Pseudomonadota bacterium]
MQNTLISRLLNKHEAAAIIGIQPHTLDKWRMTGKGPRFVKVGRHRRYDPADIQAWIESQKSQ